MDHLIAALVGAVFIAGALYLLVAGEEDKKSLWPPILLGIAGFLILAWGAGPYIVSNF